MSKRTFFIQLFILLILSSGIGCGPASLANFDSELWKSDQNGCKEERLKLYKVILSNQDELLGLNNKQIIKLLGMPERNELYQRNQKFFIYNISPTSVCKSENESEKLFLFVRFNAVGLSQELFIQNNPSFKQ